LFLSLKLSGRNCPLLRELHAADLRCEVLLGRPKIIGSIGGACSTRGQDLLACLLATYLLTYLLTPWNRVLLEKLTGLQLVKKFTAFYGTRRFITAFTRARQLSLS
jgi:hypothetical protein